MSGRFHTSSAVSSEIRIKIELLFRQVRFHYAVIKKSQCSQYIVVYCNYRIYLFLFARTFSALFRF